MGIGSIGARHVRCLQQTGRVEVMICEPNTTRRNAILEDHDIEIAYDDVARALANDSQYEAVVICVPAHLHIPMALEFARRGKHLLIEKPLSTSLDDVQQLEDTVRKRGLVAGVAYVYRHHPALQAMCDGIARDRIGRVVQIVAVSGQHFPTYRPAYRDIYYTRHATGGGAVQDALTHIINVGQWLVGPINRLVADTAHQVLDGVDVEDTVHVIARHSDVMGCYSLNQHQAPNELTITVNGTRGTVRFENHNCRIRWMAAPDSTWSDQSFGPLQRDDLFVAQANAYLSALDQSGPIACSLRAARETLDANLAILASAQSRAWIT